MTAAALMNHHLSSGPELAQLPSQPDGLGRTAANRLTAVPVRSRASAGGHNYPHDCCWVQVLGTGELTIKGLTIKAASFSDSAKQKIEAAGCTAEVIPQKPKWTRKLHNYRLRQAAAAAADANPADKKAAPSKKAKKSK